MAGPRGKDPSVVSFMAAIRAGDVDAVQRQLADDPALVSARLTDAKGGSRTPLHAATDWPGYFPNGPDVVRILLAAGADPNVRTTGRGQGESPLHWAASTDDSDVAEVLIDGGADIEAPEGSIGTPLANAVGYGCWNVAHLLVGRGATVDELWIAAALGLMPKVAKILAASPGPTPDDITEAFWQACHGGQRRVAEHLLALGADINSAPSYSGQTPLQVAAEPGTRKEILCDWLRERGAQSAESA